MISSFSWSSFVNLIFHSIGVMFGIKIEQMLSKRWRSMIEKKTTIFFCIICFCLRFNERQKTRKKVEKFKNESQIVAIFLSIHLRWMYSIGVFTCLFPLCHVFPSDLLKWSVTRTHNIATKTCYRQRVAFRKQFFVRSVFRDTTDRTKIENQKKELKKRKKKSEEKRKKFL